MALNILFWWESWPCLSDNLNWLLIQGNSIVQCFLGNSVHVAWGLAWPSQPDIQNILRQFSVRNHWPFEFKGCSRVGRSVYWGFSPHKYVTLWAQLDIMHSWQFLVFFCLSIGGILLILIIYKYMKPADWRQGTRDPGAGGHLVARKRHRVAKAGMWVVNIQWRREELQLTLKDRFTTVLWWFDLPLGLWSLRKCLCHNTDQQLLTLAGSLKLRS